VKDYFGGRAALKGKTLALWGLAFKANTDDIRETPALDIIQALTEHGMQIRAFDPVAGTNAARELAGNPLVEITEKQYDALQGADALAVVTDWNQFRNPDFKRIKTELKGPVIFDGRNLYSPTLMAAQGFTYFSIGRAPVN